MIRPPQDDRPPAIPLAAAEVVAQLVAKLQRLRVQVGNPSLRALADLTPFSHTTVARALKGVEMPSKRVVVALAEACGARGDHWAREYDRCQERILHLTKAPADTHLEDPEPPSPTMPGPQPATVGTPAELAEAMRSFWIASGWSLRQVAKRSTRTPQTRRTKYAIRGLPSSTIANLCDPSLNRIPEKDAIVVFLHTLGLTDAVVHAWEEAYLRVKLNRDTQRRSDSPTNPEDFPTHSETEPPEPTTSTAIVLPAPVETAVAPAPIVLQSYLPLHTEVYQARATYMKSENRRERYMTVVATGVFITLAAIVVTGVILLVKML